MSKRAKIIASALAGVVCAGALACFFVFRTPGDAGTPGIGLVSSENNWYYYDENGIQQFGWQTIDGKLYYFDPSSGRAVTGWFTAADGSVYYFDQDGRMVTGELMIDGDSYVFGEDGKLLEEASAAEFTWKVIDGEHYCLDAQGNYLTGLQDVGGWLYYFDEQGARQTGWQTINGKLYFFNAATGRAARGWMSDEEGTYYFGSEGYALTGEQTIGGESYTFDDNGRLKVKGAAVGAQPPAVPAQPATPQPGAPQQEQQTPAVAYVFTQQEDGTTLLTADGKPVEGAVTVEGKAYLCVAGIVQTGWVNYNNLLYCMDESTGVAKAGWQTNDAGASFYISTGGSALANLQLIDGGRYYFHPTTFQRMNGLQLVGGKLYYFAGANDAAVTGWYTIDEEVPAVVTVSARAEDAFAVRLLTADNQDQEQQGKRFYFCAEHYALTGITEISGELYAFNNQGVQLFGWHDTDEARYYFGGLNGEAVKGAFATHNEGEVYLGADGKAQAGLIEKDGKLYYTNAKGVRQKGWITTDRGTFCFNGENDAALTNAWQPNEAGTGQCYLGADGLVYTGVQQVEGVWYGFDSTGTLLSGWQDLPDGVYLFGEDGVAQTGWQQRGEGGWYYLGENGGAVKGLYTVSGEGTYYLNNTTGLREGGLKTVNGKTYLFNGEGQKALTGAQQHAGKHYLFGQDGAAQSGVYYVTDGYYYYDANGVRGAGWQTVGGAKYYFDVESCKAVTGWFTDADTAGIYYFSTENAQALVGTHTIDNRSYQFGADGRMAPDADVDNNWVTDSGKTYYLGSDGKYVTGLQTIGGAYYYFNDAGVRQTGWKEMGTARYYFDGETGKAVSGWFTDAAAGNKRYYFGADGSAYTGIQKIGSDWYAFDATGAQRTGPVTQEGERYYFDSTNDGKAVTGWYPKDKTGTTVRYYDPEYANAYTGIKEIGQEKYLFNDEGILQTGRYTDAYGRIYFFSGTGGAAVKGEYSPDGTNYYYLTADGYAAIGLVQLQQDGPWYYFDSKGVRQTGWHRLNGNRYYFQADGSSLTGLHNVPQDSADQYYFHAEGYALVGTHEMGDGRTYVFDNDGKLISKEATTGYQWVEEGGVWYYKNSANEHYTGLTNLDGDWYFFTGEGAAETGWKTIDGKRYLFGDDRKAVIGWHRTMNGDVLEAYYFCADGYALTGEHTMDGSRFVFSSEGVLEEGTIPVYNQWEPVDGGWVYFDSTGKLATGLRTIDGKVYLFSDAGLRLEGHQQYGTSFYYLDPAKEGVAQGGWLQIDGRWYLFSQNTFEQELEWQYRLGADGVTYTHYYNKTTGLSPDGFGLVNGAYRYFHADGHMATGWETIGGHRYYFYQSGERASGVVSIGGQVYSFDSEGRQQDGWNTDKGGNRYYFRDGVALTGWDQVEGRYYCFDTDGHQLVDWQYRDTGNGVMHTFYYYEDGSLPQSGWITLNSVERYVYADGHMATGWSVIDDYLYYFDKKGVATTGDYTVDGVSYSFDEEGRLPLGWTTGGMPRYYYGENGAAKGWHKVEDVWYRFDDTTAKQLTGWQSYTDDGLTTKHYFDAEGTAALGQATIQGYRYYFGENGAMAEGWVTIGDVAYYYRPGTGRLATGAVTIDGVQYSFDADGRLMLGWNTDEDGSRYYFTENGAHKGWQQVAERWYHFDEETGIQQLGWQQRTVDGDTLYYFYFDNGDLAQAGWNTAIDGEERYVLADGQMAQGWLDVNGKKLCFDEKGLPAAGWVQIDGRWYAFDKNGTQLTGWQERKPDTGEVEHFFFFEDGSLPAAGWTTAIDGQRRYVTANGAMPANGWMTIGGAEYYFTDKGIPHTGQQVIGGKTYGFDSEGRYIAPPVISKVDYETGWEATKKVTITASVASLLGNKTLQYSFDGGKTWQAENSKSIAAGTLLSAGTLQVKDTIGNISKYDTAIQIETALDKSRGIDVSAWQGHINWSSVKASGIDYAIIRSLTWDRNAYNPKKGTYTGYYVIDPYFEINVRNAKAAGIKVGTYLYSYAFNKDEMLEEIDFFMKSNAIKNLYGEGIYFDLPVFIDYEDPLVVNNTTYSQKTEIVEYGCILIDQMSRKLHGKLMVAGFYTYESFASDLMNAKHVESLGYEFWLANFTGKHTWHKNPDIWQYSSTGSVSGIAGNVDMNVMYADYAYINPNGKVPAPATTEYQLTVYDQNTGKNVTGPATDILAQIVTAEVGGFRNSEVYKAQAIAAHTWLLYQYNVAKVQHPTVALKTPTTDVQAAVNEVAGQYLTYGGDVALTPYYAWSSGKTNQATYWNASNNMPYLKTVDVPYDSSTKSAYTYTMTEAEMKARIIEIYGSDLTAGVSAANWVKITSTNTGGYVTGVSICGKKNPSVDYFYQSFLKGGVKSPSFTVSYANGTFTFTGKGNGHGIGMSQNGAFGLATQSNYTYRQILSYFYPGTSINKL